MFRKIAALAVVVLAAWATHRLVYTPWRCNVVEHSVRESTAQISDQDPLAVRSIAERNVSLLQPCIERCAADVQLPLLAGANLMILGRADAAAAMFERALKYDQRPELYANLARAQIALGQRGAAVQSLVRAGDFAGKEALLRFEDVLVRKEAYGIVARNEDRALSSRGKKRAVVNLVRNGAFALPGSEAIDQPERGSGSPWPTAAQSWTAYASTPSTLTTELVASTRRPGGRMLRVTTDTRDSGIFQTWGGRDGVSPANVVTTAWVFVRSGQVSVGTGDGSKTVPDVYSRTTGHWEKLSGPNSACPANQTIIYAASAGADFDVDWVEVVEVPGPACEQR